LLIFILLFFAGSAAGFINTLAGGGSAFVLPILILAGLPSPVANATNRVAILMQNITGVSRFHKHKMLDVKPVIHIAIAASIGAIAGSFFAVKLDSALFDKILGFVFIFVLIMVLRPKKKRSVAKILPRWLEFIIFLAVGFYGGFIQVGIGFVLLATLSLVENFSLVRANAVKVFIVMCYTVFAVIIFAISGKIIWLYGFVLAGGNMLGAWIGVHVAVKKGDKIVKIVLSVAIVIACLKLFGILKLIGL